MKIVACLRFTWAIILIVNAISRNTFTLSGLESHEIIPGIAEAIISLTFILYCIIMGLQDWKNERLIHAKYFNAFGLVFEILILMITFYLLILMLGDKSEVTQIAFFALWNAGLLILIYADIRRMWIGKREYTNE